MMKSDPILEQDILIGQYVLGLLSQQETRRLQTLLDADPAAARTALRWEEAFLSLVDALPRTEPPRGLLDQILNTLDLPLPIHSDTTSASSAPEPALNPDLPETITLPPANKVRPASDVAILVPQPAPPVKPVLPKGSADQPVPTSSSRQSNQIQPSADQSLDSTTPTSPDTRPAAPENHASKTHAGRSRALRTGSIIAAITLLAVLALTLLPRQPAEPPIVIVEIAPSKGAILQAPGQSSTPGWVVTIDQENNVTLSPQVSTDTPAEKSVQLWTYSRAEPQPRSLGLIDPNQAVAIPAELMGTISDDQFFEMTLEPAGGSPTSEPTGPILFIGQVVTFSQPPV